MVEATGTEDLVAELVAAAEEKAEEAKTVYDENDGDLIMEML